jgi:hypothetical protein
MLRIRTRNATFCQGILGLLRECHPPSSPGNQGGVAFENKPKDVITAKSEPMNKEGSKR